MSGPTFYLETSVWGSLAPRQPRDRTQVVHRLIGLLDGLRGQCVISAVVLAEINEAPASDADQIRQFLDRAQPTVHPITEAVEALARAYIAAGVLPETREADALHRLRSWIGPLYIRCRDHRAINLADGPRL